MAITVLIPALNPVESMIEVVDALVSSDKINHILLVDDGSREAHQSVFQSAAARPKVKVLRHAVNLGKGAALRTGMNYFLCLNEADAVLVTADADGQHLPDDIIAVGEKAEVTRTDLVLGSRSFSGDVPLRSRFGNDVTRRIFRFVVGPKVTDTQTGLRAIPRALMPKLLRAKANGYEFELQMLIMAAQDKINISAVPIQTVYIDENASSHFNPLKDSMRIYFVFIRFLSSSLVASVVDFILFALIFGLTHSLAWSIGIARLFSGTLNFTLNKGFVFRSRASLVWSITKFAAQETLLAVISLLVIRSLVMRADWNPYLAKPLVEIVLFICSFAVQRVLVFERAPDEDD
ncbi:MAG: bifunctional glycosyltransferase family 2/GtrA family protein [Verrucomicrobia bacterium]|nr:bifunctional glycosyltransferase family 2/GtrA family protein [Verrucomicrobiota bacterium]